MSGKMKAIRVHEFGGPDVLRIDDVEELSAGPGQVLVEVHAAGVNPVDTYIRSGTYALKPDLPYTPGFDGAGVARAVGEGVDRPSVGERVYFGGTVSGSYAELAICDATSVHPLPDNVSFAQGAGVNVPYATAYRALVHKAHGRAGETVLVHGASGGVGIASVQLARALGMRVVGTAGSVKGQELVAREGAHKVLDHSKDDYLDELMEWTEGAGVDVVLEMLANVNLGKDLTVLAPGGRVAVIGSRGNVEINPRDAMAREATVVGVILLKAPPDEMVETHAAIVAGLANGTLRPIVGREFSLADARRAHEDVMAPGAFGKIVLRVRD
jgi:NADPH2:quinone reductase